MPAAVIPVTGINEGFVGNISNEGYPLRIPRNVRTADTYSISFGESLVLNSDNTYSSVKQLIANMLAATAGSGGLFQPNVGIYAGGNPLGIAVANVKTNTTPTGFLTNGAANVTSGYFLPGTTCDALVKGTIDVAVINGTPSGAGAGIYIATAVDTSIPARVVGGFEAVTDPDYATTTATAASGATALTVASATGIVAGMVVSGAGISTGTLVQSVSGTTVNLTSATTAALSTTSVTFSHNILLQNIVWKTGKYTSTVGIAQATIITQQLP